MGLIYVMYFNMPTGIPNPLAMEERHSVFRNEVGGEFPLGRCSKAKSIH
jgi:hypothetical protein